MVVCEIDFEAKIAHTGGMRYTARVGEASMFICQHTPGRNIRLPKIFRSLGAEMGRGQLARRRGGVRTGENLPIALDSMDLKNLKYIAAPMVNQSDLPFRCLVGKYGATMSYTQMLIPDRLLNDQEYLEFHTRDLSLQGASDGQRVPVIVQLCGNDPQLLVSAGRKLQAYCDGIDLNLGCSQEAARDGHFGAYLLGHKDWPLVESIVSSMAHSFTVPVSAKLRLCQPTAKTYELAERLEAQGASWISLHARTVSARRRRQGPADLSVVKELKTRLGIPTISNGNVRVFGDIQKNLDYTGADGIMVGETLLSNPCIFADTMIIPDPFDISLEYLRWCSRYSDTATLSAIQTHIRHFVEFQYHRKPWFHKFRAALAGTQGVDEMEHLLRFKAAKWRGTAKDRSVDTDESLLEETSTFSVNTSNDDPQVDPS